MSSDNEPTWRICRKAVWMLIRNYNNLADAENVLNRQDEANDLHIEIGKCFVLFLTAVGTAEDKSRLERALAECRRLEERCHATRTSGGWMHEVGRRLFSTAAAAAGADEYDRQIALADVTVCIAVLTLAAHRNSPSVTAMARAVCALRRAWRAYRQCYADVLNVYRDAYDTDADQNTPRWPPVLKRRQSVVSTSNIGSRMLRSATTSFEMLRQNSVSNIMPKDVVRLMTAVSVGYGAFNLMVSLLPPTIVSVIGMVGFCGNRQTGLDALAFAKHGPDVHAPLAWGILSWYRMMGNTDFMFDGPQSRENESHVYESEQLVCNPPEEFRNSTTLQYFIGRSCFLKGDIEGSIRAYEIGSTLVDYCYVNMKAIYSHELGFMYAIRLDWKTACRKFASVARDNVWMRPYHYFMAMVCAAAAGDVATAELMSRRTDETVDGRRLAAERDTLGNFVADRKRAVADVPRRRTTTTTTTTTTANAADDDRKRHCRLVVFEMLYVKYGTASWPADALHAVLADCRENECDDETTRYQKKLLAIVCRKALSPGSVGDHRRCLIEIVEQMERDERRDHLYAYGLYELAAEQVANVETVDDGKRTIQKLIHLKGPYNFQYFYEIRCASLQAYVQRSKVR